MSFAIEIDVGAADESAGECVACGCQVNEDGCVGRDLLRALAGNTPTRIAYTFMARYGLKSIAF